MARTKDKYIWDDEIQDFRLARPRIITRALKLLEWVRSWPIPSKLAAAALLLRIYQLGAGAFWYDEGVSVILARLPFKNMIAATAGDVHPPLYYLFLWILARIGIPLTEFTARLPSLALSVIAVYLAWELASRFIETKRGRYVVMAWVIISPLQLHYAQEARMYALLQVEILAAILLMLDGKKIGLALVLTAVMYTHNYAVFYLPVLALAAFINNYGDYIAGFRVIPVWRQENLYTVKLAAQGFIKKWAVYFLVPVLAWLPWFIVLAGQMETVSGGYWIQPVKIPSVLFVLYQMFFAYSMPATFQGLGVLLTCGLLIYMSWRLYRDRPRRWLLLAVLALGPLLLAVLFSLAWRPVLLFRGLIGSSVPIIILAVMSIEQIGPDYKKYYAYTMIAVTLAAGLVGHYLYNAENKGLTTTWVDQIESSYKSGDVVVALNDNGIVAAMTYAPDLEVYKLTGCGQEPLGSLSPATRQALGVTEKNVEDLLPIDNNLSYQQQYNRIWFISTLAPVSPQCEIDLANNIINMPGSRQVINMHNDEYTQAGVYLIFAKGKY